MGWRRIRGKDYLYALRPDFFGTREVCLKGNPGIMPTAKEVAEEKREARMKDRATARQFWDLSSAIDQLTKTAQVEVTRKLRLMMLGKGYRYKNGEWRKMQQETIQNTEGWTAAELRNLEIDKLYTIEHHIRKLALGGIRNIGPACRPINEEDIDDIFNQVLDKLVDLREEFQFEQSSPMEKLLIEQIMTAWVQWYIASWQVETAAIDHDYHRKNNFLEKKYARCQARLSRTIDQLAKLRCVPREYLVESKPAKTAARKVRRVRKG